jgi:predicted TIM-barrel fold metal-dependent hydrolase
MTKIFQIFAGEEGPPEEILEPELPIVDAHHHLWPDDSPIASYPVDVFLKEDVLTGHNIVATVFAECMAAYHADGDEALRPVGETEFVVGTCPLVPGRPRIAAGIIGWADLRAPTIAARTLDAHIEAGQGRFSGVRHNVYWHENQAAFTTGPRTFPRHLLLDPTFREGLAEVDRRGLTYDVWMYSDQLPELAETADRFPDLTIVLCHMGGPVTADPTPEGRREIFERWRVQLADVARRPNVHLKLGGMGMGHFGFGYDRMPRRPTGEQLAALWRPYFEVALDAFGPARCLAESNFPPDKHGYSYAAFWNALKLLSRDCSAEERRDLFTGTASRVYKLDLDMPG